MRPLIVALVLVGGLAGVLAGCAGDDGPDEAERSRLADSLGFLGTDLGLTDDEVACTARTIEEQLAGADLDEVAAQVRRVDQGDQALEDLPAEVRDTITRSLVACAGSAS